MTFRISLRVFFTVWAFAFVSKAQTTLVPDKSWVNAYQTKEIQFVSPGSDYAAATPGRHPQWLHQLMENYATWEPEDKNPRPVDDCELFKLREALRLASDLRLRARVAEQYQARCAGALNQGPTNPFEQALKMFTMKYNLDENPFFHRVVFHLPDGQKLKAVLALKDTRVRPWVIIRMGVTGNIEEAFAERFFLYQLFERGLVNVLMVENMTSPDYIHFNRRMSFGGIAEAYQNIWLAQTLRSPQQPLSRLVHSVHLVGLSLGGQGVLTSAWLARYQANPHLVSSYMAFCPVVNMPGTFDYLFKKSLLRFPLEFWARARFQEVKKFRPDLFKKTMGLPNRLLSAVAQNYRKPWAPYLGIREPWFIQKQTDFYSLHDLSKWDPTLRDPVWVWVTNDDDIVPPSLNADLMQLAPTLHINQGTHCSFPVVWDNRVLSTMMMGHVLGSSGFIPGEKEVKLDLDPKRVWDITDIRVLTDRPVVEVELGCDKTRKSFTINRSDLDFYFTLRSLTVHDQMMIKRWISTNLRWRPDPTGMSLVVSWPMVK